MISSFTWAQKQVEAAPDDLVKTGALQLKNQMDIESLLNPAGESQTLMETSDMEIYQVVTNLIDAPVNPYMRNGICLSSRNGFRLGAWDVQKSTLTGSGSGLRFASVIGAWGIAFGTYPLQT